MVGDKYNWLRILNSILVKDMYEVHFLNMKLYVSDDVQSRHEYVVY